MRSFRSKPVGWQHDHHRHYLAAKYGSAGGLKKSDKYKKNYFFAEKNIKEEDGIYETDYGNAARVIYNDETKKFEAYDLDMGRSIPIQMVDMKKKIRDLDEGDRFFSKKYELPHEIGSDHLGGMPFKKPGSNISKSRKRSEEESAEYYRALDKKEREDDDKYPDKLTEEEWKKGGGKSKKPRYDPFTGEVDGPDVRHTEF